MSTAHAARLDPALTAPAAIAGDVRSPDLSDVQVDGARFRTFNGQHAVATIDGADVMGYVFTRSDGVDVFTTRAAQRTKTQPRFMKQTGEISTRMERTAPRYLSCAPPGHWWEPADLNRIMVCTSMRELTPESAIATFSAADRLEAADRHHTLPLETHRP